MVRITLPHLFIPTVFLSLLLLCNTGNKLPVPPPFNLFYPFQGVVVEPVAGCHKKVAIGVTYITDI